MSNSFFETSETDTDNGLSLAEVKAECQKEIDAKTARAKSLHAQVLQCGKDSIAHAIECGNELKEIKSLLGQKHWGKWVKENTGPGFSYNGVVTRYMRLAKYAADESLGILIQQCETLTEAMAVCGIRPDKKDKGSDDDTNGTDKTETKTTKPKRNEFETVKKHCDQIQQAIQKIESPSTRSAAILLLKPLAKLYCDTELVLQATSEGSAL